MTVIVYDGKTLAADSRITCGGNITTDSYNKIHVLRGSIDYLGDELLAIGVSGTASDVLKLIEHLQSSDYPVKKIDHEIHALIVGKKYIYELYPHDSHLIRYNKKTKLAIGSGGTIANSVMMLGLDASQAVKHAISMNVYCGGRVRTWSMG